MLSRFLQGGGELLVPITSHHQPASLRLQALELFASMVDKASVPGLNKDNVDKLNLPSVLIRDILECLQPAQ